MNTEKIYKMTFARVYPLYIAKVERKWRTQAEVDQVIMWLTGYDAAWLQAQIASNNDFETFFAQAPQIHPNASLITGTICGYRIEDIQDPVVKQVRYMDKLIDELAKGRAMEKILRG